MKRATRLRPSEGGKMWSTPVAGLTTTPEGRSRCSECGVVTADRGLLDGTHVCPKAKPVEIVEPKTSSKRMLTCIADFRDAPVGTIVETTSTSQPIPYQYEKIDTQTWKNIRTERRFQNGHMHDCDHVVIRWGHASSVEPIENHPTELATEGDFESAPVGTIVGYYSGPNRRATDCVAGSYFEKTANGKWRDEIRADGVYDNKTMVRHSVYGRMVLRWGPA
jgi:hypothetical protein